MGNARKTSAKKKESATAELGGIRQWMKDHEKQNNTQFKAQGEQLKKVATKDDLSIVMLDQASKKDMQRLTDALFDEKGLPLFATKADMAPVLDLYKGGVFTKSLVLGMAAVIGGIVGIGWGLLQLGKWIAGVH